VYITKLTDKCSSDTVNKSQLPVHQEEQDRQKKQQLTYANRGWAPPLRNE